MGENKKTISKIKRIRSKKGNVVRIGVFSLLLLIIVIVIIYIINLNRKLIETKDLYQWVGNNKIEYLGVLQISNKGQISELKTENEKSEIDFTPIYYKNESKMLTPFDMAIVEPLKDGKTSKLNRFSVINKKQDGIYTEKEKRELEIENSFIFNGKDLYVFLEETVVTVDGQEYIMSPMSYANVSYRAMVELYDKESDKGNIIITKSTGIIAKTGNYEINMSIDSLNVGAKEQLLLKSLNNLSIYE